MKKRILSTILAAAMIAAALPAISLPVSAGAEGAKSIMLDANGIATGDKVYYGNYGGSPVMWRVLSLDGNGGTYGVDNAQPMFLLSENILGNTKFDDTDPYSNAWQGSTAQAWCKDFAGTYNGTTFTSNALTETEYKAILSTTKTDGTGTVGALTYGASSLTSEKVFFLSGAEAGTYFSDSSDRVANYGNGAYYWWLRSPNADVTGTAGLVGEDGIGYVSNVYDPAGARLAFNLNQSSVLFTSAASGGKSSNGVGAGALNLVSTDTPTEWKLTLKDSDRSGFTVTETTLTAAQGGTATVNYSGAQTGTDEYISAMICDGSDNVLYYGRIELATNEATNSADITIPANLPTGTYKLKIFNEQYNGDYQTDYSSELKEIALTVTVPPELVFTDSAAYDIPAGTVGTLFTSTTALTATGGTAPYTFTIDPAVTGLSVNNENKLVYTRPAEQAETTATVRVTDSGNPAQTKTITINIGAVTPAPVPVPTIFLDTDGIATGDKVYYGNYNSSPVMWRVLSLDGNGGTYDVTDAQPMFLLSENILKYTPFGSSNAWQGSTAQAWCTSFYGGNTFSDKTSYEKSIP